MPNQAYKVFPEHFRAAAAYLTSFGWRQWTIGQHGKPRCAVGALRSVAQMCEETQGDRRTLSRRLNLVATRYLNELQPFGHRSGLMTFNDTHGREAVIRLFEGIANYLERRTATPSLDPYLTGSSAPTVSARRRGATNQVGYPRRENPAECAQGKVVGRAAPMQAAGAGGLRIPRPIYKSS
jgi:hypothetical protein